MLRPFKEFFRRGRFKKTDYPRDGPASMLRRLARTEKTERSFVSGPDVTDVNYDILQIGNGLDIFWRRLISAYPKARSIGLFDGVMAVCAAEAGLK